MVLIDSIPQIYEIIDSPRLFSNIGKPAEDTSSFQQITDLTEAAKFWKEDNFQKARSVAWEAFRQEIYKNKKSVIIWEKAFNVCNEKIVKSVLCSSRSLDLIRFLGQDVREFCLCLPFVAAIGELLIKDKLPEYSFNLTQVSTYSVGHWVCGWHGILNEDAFNYPDLKFFFC